MSIFKEGENTNSPQGDSQSPSPVSDNSFEHLLDEIKNENGERKYKDLGSALNALKHSQEYIPDVKSQLNSLTAENEQLKAQADKLTDLESIVQKLTAKEAPTVTPTDNGLSEQKVAELLEQTLTQREQRQKQGSNLDSVTKALKDSFGENAEKEFYSKATELGLSKEQFEELAKTSPTAVLKFFPEQKAAPSVTTGHNSAGLFTSTKENSGVSAPKESVLAGATSSDLMAEFHKHRDAVYSKHGVQQ